ncbi:MAG: hypothetical protein CMH63_01110 [Nanoarchaeota archaeon]|jgi:uncharacterized membrane protein (DUF106 family)|nr:hypothetical protein [Nanoarchaeota archaeon]|tara:strand:- start:19405 stop:19842 length:438 start_codon:yes stop_codon:yes gene_type:complete
MLNGFFNAIFGFLINWHPLGALIIISFLLTALITVAYKYFTDQELMKSLKAELKELQGQMKEAKHDTERLMQLQKQSMEKNMKYMMNSFKPTLITLVPILIIFSWLRATYSEIDLNFLGIHSWIWIYIIFSIVFSIGLRKILRVH